MAHSINPCVRTQAPRHAHRQLIVQHLKRNVYGIKKQWKQGENEEENERKT
jgi:hypothetical protein